MPENNKVNVQMQIIQRVVSLSVERVFCEAGFSKQDAQRFISGELLLSPIELEKIADVLGVHKKLLLEKQEDTFKNR